MKKVLLGSISVMLFTAVAYLPCNAAKVHQAVLSLSSSQTLVKDTIPVQSKHPPSDRQDNLQTDTTSPTFPTPNTDWKTKNDTTIKDTMKDDDWNTDSSNNQMQVEPSMAPTDTTQQK